MDPWEQEKVLRRTMAYAMGAEEEAKACRKAIEQLAARPMSPMDRDAIVEAVATRVSRAFVDSSKFVTTEILTREEAMVYVKRRSERAFRDWCKRWHVKPHQRGRYSRTQLDLALSREGRLRG